ncbi:MAG TPA: HYR domain-containing protein, partial [Chitinophagaceae bacterium]
TNNAPLQFPAGVTNVTWTATDENGITVTGVQQVTVTDAEPPVITAPADINITLFAGQTQATGVSTGTATATDNLPGVTISADNSSATFPVGTTTITWTAKDASGNTATATQTITVVASSLPQITAPADVTVSTDPGKNYASNVAIGTAVLSTNVNGVVITNNAPAQYPVGVNYVAWTVSDASGLSATVYQKVTVTDNEAPVVTAPANITVSTNAGVAVATGVQTGIATVSDNVGASLSNNAPAVFPLGVTIITWTATDAAGNTGTAVQTVTVEDHEAPVISIPADVSVNTDPGLAYKSNVILGNATATDNVAVTTLTNNAPLQFSVGETLVTWTAADAAGNIGTAVQKVTVTDAEPPLITAPADVNVTISMSQQYATGVSLGVPVYSDNVPGVYAGNNAPAQFPVGTTIVTWTATDLAGNTATATQKVNVSVITEPPVARCKSITVALVNGSAVITAANIDNGSTAAAGIASIQVDRSVFGCNDIGTNTVILTVTDSNGLSSSCAATVTVTGSIPAPVISSNPNSSVYTGGITTNLYIGYGAQSTTLKVQPAAAGNSYLWTGSALSSYQSAAPVFTPPAAGTYPFEVTVRNASGCSASAQITICVRDIRVPGSKNKKVYICHIPPGNHANAHLLEVSTNAVPAHLQHGDRLGACNQACGTAAKATVGNLLEEEFDVKVYPNPAVTSFAFAVKSANREDKITIRVTDAFGRLVQVLNTVPGEVLTLGERYAAGVYFAEVTQGTEKQLIRLVKQ